MTNLNIDLLTEFKTNYCGIYLIYCKISNKIYLGSSANVRRRISDHNLLLRKNIHPNKHLQSAWNLYREENFIVYQIEIVDKNYIEQREQYYLDLYKPYNNSIGYNMNKIAYVPPSHKGLKRSPEFCEKIRKIKTGVKHSPEAKEKMRLAKIGKKIIRFLDINGNVIETNNIKQFCIDNKIVYEQLRRAIRGINYIACNRFLKLPDNYDNWTKEDYLIYIKQIKHKRDIALGIKYYKFINPNNEIIEIFNLCKFCKENNLSLGCMRAVYYGYHNMKSHRGYKKAIESVTQLDETI